MTPHAGIAAITEQIRPQSAESASRKRTKQGEQTRQLILQAAVQMASREGLESLSIGKLAAELNMSKSGLFAHFKSKEDLQISTIAEACSLFNEEVLYPALAVEKGVKRLWKLCKGWLRYGDREASHGGCFFTNVASEYDGRSGPVRDVVAQTMQDWLQCMQRLLKQAQDTGELRKDADVEQLAFEFNALFFGASLAFQLSMDPSTGRRMKTAVKSKLLSVAVSPKKLETLLPM
ncbi:MAG TPA: TetR/AcrR family transcriptional regulator [Oculatellaceae cyanobacterium]